MKTVKGKPGVAARELLIKEVTEQAKRAVKEGKPLLIRPFADTTVLITSSNADQAVSCATAVIPVADPTEAELERGFITEVFHMYELMLSIQGLQAKHRKAIGKSIKRMQDSYDRGAAVAD